MNLREGMPFFSMEPHPPQGPAQSPTGSFVDQATPALVTLWRTIGRSRYWVLGLMLGGLVAGWALGRFMVPVYEAVTTLLIEAGKPNVVSIQDVYQGLSSDRDHYRTQTQILKSREVALRVVRDLDLVDNPEFAGVTKPDAGTGEDGRSGSRVEHQGPGVPMGAAAARGERDVLTDRREEVALQGLMSRLKIEPIKQSQLVQVRFSSSDPVLAARIVNRLSEAFIEAEMDTRLQVTIAANTWLAQRVAELKRNLDTSEQVLAEGRERADLIENPAGAIIGAGQQTESLNQRLAEARVKRAEAEQAYRQVRPGVAGRENAPALASNSAVVRARELVNEAQVEMAAAADRYGSQHPAYIAAQVKLNSATSNLSQQVSATIAAIDKEYQLAISTEQALQGTLDASRRRALSDSRKGAAVALLEQDVATNRQIYQTFLSRLKETAVTGDVQTPQARIVDYAVAPTLPVWPRKAFLMAVLGFLGLLAGVTIAVLRDQLDSRIRSIEEAEQRLGLPVITTLPRLDRSQQRQRGRLVLTEPSSFFSEMVRMGAASVHFSLLDGGRKSIAITSAAPSEGKSTFASNLALALARTSRVILIDADLYRPSVHRLLPVPAPERGLRQVFMGDVELGKAVQRVPDSLLYVLPAGSLDGKGVNVLTPVNMRRLVLKLEEKFDVVIVDAPPLEVVSDAMTVSGACGHSILVVRSGATKLGLIQRATRRLRRVGSSVLGFVVNDHDFKIAERFYGEQSGHRAYEGYAQAPVQEVERGLMQKAGVAVAPATAGSATPMAAQDRAMTQAPGTAAGSTTSSGSAMRAPASSEAGGSA